MKVIINDRFFVEVDSMNYTLQQTKHSDKAGKTVTSVIGHYANMEHVFRKIAHILASEGEDCGIDEYIKRLDTVNSTLLETINTIIFLKKLRKEKKVKEKV